VGYDDACHAKGTVQSGEQQYMIAGTGTSPQTATFGSDMLHTITTLAADHRTDMIMCLAGYATPMSRLMPTTRAYWSSCCNSRRN
jgi:hypothetical protein